MYEDNRARVKSLMSRRVLFAALSFFRVNILVYYKHDKRSLISILFAMTKRSVHCNTLHFVILTFESSFKYRILCFYTIFVSSKPLDNEF